VWCERANVHLNDGTPNPTTRTQMSNTKTTAKLVTTDLDTLLERIAQQHLSIETLATRNRDALDFHDVGVASLKAALKAAYQAGVAAADKND
jgi:hypothetical protein